MNLEEIRTEVEVIVDDPSYDSDRINSYINQCISYTAGQVSIPSLKRIGSIVTQTGLAYTSVSSVSNSEVFSGRLRKVRKSDGSFPAVYPDLERLMNDYEMDEEGEVEAVALEGSTLWYALIPASPETLTILYYVDPSLLIRNEDVPSSFPDFLHNKLLVHGTAWMIFDQIEDKSELEGNKERTTSHYWLSFDTRNPSSGINLMREWMARIRPHHISSIWDY